VRGPFAGRVTGALMDPGPGMLVTNAQTNFVSAMPMLTILSDDTRCGLRLSLQQSDVTSSNVGDVAECRTQQTDRIKMAKITP